MYFISRGPWKKPPGPAVWRKTESSSWLMWSKGSVCFLATSWFAEFRESVSSLPHWAIHQPVKHDKARAEKTPFSVELFVNHFSFSSELFRITCCIILTWNSPSAPPHWGGLCHSDRKHTPHGCGSSVSMRVSGVSYFCMLILTLFSAAVFHL